MIYLPRLGTNALATYTALDHWSAQEYHPTLLGAFEGVLFFQEDIKGYRLEIDPETNDYPKGDQSTVVLDAPDGHLAVPRPILSYFYDSEFVISASISAFGKTHNFDDKVIYSPIREFVDLSGEVPPVQFTQIGDRADTFTGRVASLKVNFPGPAAYKSTYARYLDSNEKVGADLYFEEHAEEFFGESNTPGVSYAGYNLRFPGSETFHFCPDTKKWYFMIQMDINISVTEANPAYDPSDEDSTEPEFFGHFAGFSTFEHQDPSFAPIPDLGIPFRYNHLSRIYEEVSFFGANPYGYAASTPDPASDASDAPPTISFSITTQKKALVLEP